MTIKNLLKKISSVLQKQQTSYLQHNRELETEGKFEIERKIAFENIETDAINGAELKIKDLLINHPNVTVAVDIGSGAGWASAALSKLVNRVIAIEPSQAGINIAKKITAELKCTNITWHNGLAEVILPSLELKEQTLFITGCVFSHMRDQEVAEVCRAVTEIAPTGSLLSFAECWGDEAHHQIMWHVRTKDWWQAQLPGWELTFHGPQVPNTNYHKGIWGVKKS